MPVYNPDIQMFLKCIQSALKIAIPLEIILVNDGSEMSYDKLCKELQKNDCRIKYFFTENGGVSKARNYGISKAVGKYIYFLDADDLIPQQFIEFINSNWKSINEDWIIFDVLEYNPKIEKYRKRELFNNDGENVLISDILKLFVTTSKLYECWGKLIKREMVNKYQIVFPLGIIQGEDVYFNSSILQVAKTIRYYKLEGYQYTYILKNTERLLKNPYKRFDILEQIYGKMVELIHQKKIDEQQLIKVYNTLIIRTFGHDCIKLAQNKQLDNNMIAYIEAWIKKNIDMDSLKVKDFKNLKDKMFYILVKYRLWKCFSIIGKMKRVINIFR